MRLKSSHSAIHFMLPLAIALALLSCFAGAALAQLVNPFRPPINYEKASPDDAVSMLLKKIDGEEVSLLHENEHGYLRSILKQLEVPISSQVLVYSRTSLQRSRIGPKTPRAIFFNDEVTVGFCLQGDVLEIAAADPKLGTNFYAVDQNPARQGRILRQTERCLLCHGSSTNQGLPGHLIRSVYPDRMGEPTLFGPTKRVDHTTPFADRWGGWYVTGTSGKQHHLGNKIYAANEDPKVTDGVNVTDLKTYFKVEKYLSPHSDLVALMVLEHQSEGHNRLAQANLLTRIALAEQVELNRESGRPPNESIEATSRRIRSVCEPLVEYLLFSKEAQLHQTVSGTAGFAKEFTARGPFDSKGRTLREFDLNKRMFRYPLSYLVYTRAFDGLPTEAKEQVYRRLWEVLSGKDRSESFAHLSAEDRNAIREIVIATKRDLPKEWK